MFSKILDDILLILNIKDTPNEIMTKITLSFKLCLGYNLLENAGKEIQKVFNISDEKRDKITDLINEYKYELRFWNINGDTIEDYRNYDFFQKGILTNTPKKNDIKSCLKELSAEGKDLIRIYFSIESNEIDDIKAGILNNMEDVLKDYDPDYLDILLNFDNNPYSNYIYSALLYSGLLYLYKDNDKLKVLISDEAKNGIKEILKNNNNITLIDTITNRYLKENGIISIDRLLCFLHDYHNVTVTKDQIMEIVEKHGIPIKKEKYLVYSPGLTDLDIENILRKKEMISEQHIVNLEEPDFIEDFLKETDEYLMYLPQNDKEFISSYFFSMILFGSYNRKYFKELLKENNLEKHMNALDDIATKYKNDVGIWTLNGYSKKQFEEKRKKQKVGRNDPCPCGSGKKYKNCCGRNA